MFLGHDQLKTAFLQSNVQSIAKIPNYSPNDIVQRILREEDLIRNREDQGVIPSSTALVSQANQCAPITSASAILRIPVPSREER